jgi:histidinol-phosphatase
MTRNDVDRALHMADAADSITMAAFRSTTLRVETKPDLTPVSEADRAVEQQLRALLATECPSDAILGEEYGAGDSDGPGNATGRRWIIDPIDGTKNFVRGVPVWATLIALADESGIAVGVVSAPALARRWWAHRDGGAWSQGPEDSTPRRLSVSAITDLADASVSVSDAVGWPSGALDALAARTWRMRAYGDFWSHLMVAEGSVDIAVEPELNLWDFAALVPIIVEAGGCITNIDGSPPSMSAVSTNGHLHDAVIALLEGS